MNALQIAKRVARSSHVTAPNSLLEENSYATNLLLAINLVGQELLYEGSGSSESWTDLNIDYTLVTEANKSTYNLPENFNKIITNTVYDQTTFRAQGPETPSQWYTYEYGFNAYSNVSYRFRIVSGTSGRKAIQLAPTPPQANDELYFQYTSKFWVKESETDSPTAYEVTKNTQVPIYPFNLFFLGVKFIFKQYEGILDDIVADEQRYKMMKLKVFTNEVPQDSFMVGGGTPSMDYWDYALPNIKGVD